MLEQCGKNTEAWYPPTQSASRRRRGAPDSLARQRVPATLLGQPLLALTRLLATTPMAEQAGCCEGEGRAATVAVLVLSIIVFMANIYAMVVAIDIHAYYWIMTYHFVGTIGVLVATSVYACRCCGEGGFSAAAPGPGPGRVRRPLRRRLLRRRPRRQGRRDRGQLRGVEGVRLECPLQLPQGEPRVLPVRRRSGPGRTSAERQHLRRQTVRSEVAQLGLRPRRRQIPLSRVLHEEGLHRLLQPWCLATTTRTSAATAATAIPSRSSSNSF